MVMMPLFLIMLVAYGFGLVGALVVGRGMIGRGLAALGAMVGAGAGLLLGLLALSTGQTLSVSIPPLIPLTGLALRLDGLSAFFLIIIGLVGTPAALYGFGYSAAYEGRYSLRMIGALLNILLLSLGLQMLADNALTFLLAWEIMSLSAYWLVLTEHDQPGTVRASVWYIAMTHTGFVALMIMFLLLSAGELTTSFAAMRANAIALTPLARDAIFLLAVGPSHCAQPYLCAHVRCVDQDGDLWSPARDPGFVGRWPSVVGRSRAGVWCRLGHCGHFICANAK
jgi:hydrogenase-4 component B